MWAYMLLTWNFTYEMYSVCRSMGPYLAVWIPIRAANQRLTAQDCPEMLVKSSCRKFGGLVLCTSATVGGTAKTCLAFPLPIHKFAQCLPKLVDSGNFMDISWKLRGNFFENSLRFPCKFPSHFLDFFHFTNFLDISGDISEQFREISWTTFPGNVWKISRKFRGKFASFKDVRFPTSWPLDLTWEDR